ncbi:hypothetical protein LCGC14_1634540 [marine sediment metagenome]|uniref:Uncharacterized protein n=1 Tax=marine sediment metagenome TaxID=412755 RepID=A0A0F9I1Z5_9ZZZZ
MDKWITNVKVLRNENNQKYIDSTEIKENSSPKKEDVIDDSYDNDVLWRKMFYHAFKQIEELEIKLNEMDLKITELQKK